MREKQMSGKRVLNEGEDKEIMRKKREKMNKNKNK